MSDCVFCKIIAGEIPSTKIYEDEKVIAFRDINPQAPVHFLVVPKEHIESTACIDDANCDIVGHCFKVIARLAKQEGLDKGFRVINNCGPDGGQTVPHIHFHVLGGKTLGEKMI